MHQRGLSLVEMMVGVAVGLFIVAGAALLASSQLGENRRLLLETQVQQDLRAAADLITRELRRTGFISASQDLVWSPSNPGKQPDANLYPTLALNTGGDVVSYGYDRYALPGPNSYGFRLNNHVIQQRIANDPPQDLTDGSTLKVTVFQVALAATPLQQIACPRLCMPGYTQDCWPTVNVVDATVTITGEAVSDPRVTRTVVSRVRLRNEGVNFNISPSQVCP